MPTGPANGVAEIDHLLTAVDDPDAAGRAYERLGFTVTPKSVIESMGLANRLVLLSPGTVGAANFIELMGVHDQTRLNATMRDLLAGPQRVRSMVMMTADAQAAHASLEANGYAPGSVHALEREWALPGDERVQLAFDVILPLPGAPLTFNLCRYKTLAPYLREEWRQHPNGARSFVAVHAVCPDIAPVAAYFERLFGRAAESRDGAAAIGPEGGAVRLVLHTREAFSARFGRDVPADGAPVYAGFSIAVADISETRAWLSAEGVPFDEAEAGLVIGPELACGNVLAFVASVGSGR